MIRRLRIKFIVVMMSVLVIVFLIVFLTLNIFMQTSSTLQTERLLQTVVEHDGFALPPGSAPPRIEGTFISPFTPEPETIRISRFFYVKLDDYDAPFEMNFDMMFGFTEAEALEFTQKALGQGKGSGTVDNLQFFVGQKEYGKIIVFAERSIETGMLSQLIRISTWVAAGTFFVLFLLSLLLSDWAVKPVANAFMKQRRFVSDASHELKTPLTVISASADLLEDEIGANVRLTHIKEEAERMNQLAQDLLILAKMDESDSIVGVNQFDLSRAVTNTTLGFESAAYETNRQFSYAIEDGILHVGNEQQIKQLLSILIDNAIKHSDDAGEVKVALKKSGERARLSIYNTGDGIAEEEKEKIFDRFYRSDASRSRETGGYGLGLAIAKSIITAHRGKIEIVGNPGEWVKFVVTL